MMPCRYAFCLLLTLAAFNVFAQVDGGSSPPDEKLTFQSGQAWSPRAAIESNAVMCYGINSTLPYRIQTWRYHGYLTDVMTGVSWGNYGDYLHGQWDGHDHTDERQTDKSGHPLRHGDSGDIWYMSPGESYGNYLAEGIKKALDAGAQAVYLEEPEFWVRAGYSAGFRREWQKYYNEPWQPPHESVDNQYRASKLKYFLYRRALAQVFDFVKKYAAEHHREIPCYVATHSLLNYSHWRIVSPESSLLDVGCDGYIAQVWTGTARTPNVYQGIRKSRTFEAAFLEYGAMQNLVRASGRRVWYLNDPIEDDPNHSWADYRENWESTLVASLLQPEVNHFEVAPWPERVFNGRHPATEPAKPPRGSAKSAVAAPQLIGIPGDYETELQTVFHAMGDLKQPRDQVKWKACGTQGVGVLVSDTMMFQRGEPSSSDNNLGSFYGLAMPLLKHGIPVEPVQIESAAAAHFLDRYKLLLLTYEGQKPPTPQFHEALAAWVRQGGALVVIDDDKDPYSKVREWWNKPPLSFAMPRDHLFGVMGLKAKPQGLFQVGNGVVLFESLSPAALTYQPGGAQQVQDIVHQAATAIGLSWNESHSLMLRRGPYLIAAGLDESLPGGAPHMLQGRFISLFDPHLAAVDKVIVEPGSRLMLLDVDAATALGNEGVIAAACAIRDESATASSIHFTATGVEGSPAVVCIACHHEPRAVTIGGNTATSRSWHFEKGLLWTSFDNSATGIKIEINFR